jgi:hypothetical protein
LVGGRPTGLPLFSTPFANSALQVLSASLTIALVSGLLAWAINVKSGLVALSTVKQRAWVLLVMLWSATTPAAAAPVLSTTAAVAAAMIAGFMRRRGSADRATTCSS